MLYDSDTNELLTPDALELSAQQYALHMIRSLEADEAEGHIRVCGQRCYARIDDTINVTGTFAHETPNGGWSLTTMKGGNPFNEAGSPDSVDHEKCVDTYREMIAWNGCLLRFIGRIKWDAEAWDDIDIEELR